MKKNKIFFAVLMVLLTAFMLASCGNGAMDELFEESGPETIPEAPAGPETIPEAPAGLETVAPTLVGGHDGKVTGVTSAMEYSLDHGTTWTMCPEGEITGLSEGSVYVRYAATANTPAGKIAMLYVATVVTNQAALQDALDAGCEIQLGNNIDLTSVLTFGYGSNPISATLDLNGYVLRQTTDHTRVLNIAEGASLTLTDSRPTTEHVFAYNKTAAWDYKPDASGEISIDKITDSTADGTLVIVPGGIITSVSRTLDGGIDVGNRGGGAVLVTGTLVMESGSFVGCADTSSLGRGGAVLVGDGVTSTNWGNAGSFTMKGTAQIVGCAGRMGAGIMVESTAENGLVLTDSAKISYCYAIQGGAIQVNTGTFTMSGDASITECTATTYGGGVANFGTFTMSGGEIIECKAYGLEGEAWGGGVFVSSVGSTFTMSGGSITGCTASKSGGGVFVKDGTFTMSGGSITGCTATYGGGVFVEKGTFEMSGGSITGCTATYGGGVEVYSGTFTMSGGEIIECKAYGLEGKAWGGGVYNYGGTFTMSGGRIADCISRGYGGGLHTQGTTYIRGTALIENCRTELIGGVGDSDAGMGGAICQATDKGVLYIKGGVFRNNKAQGVGGALNVDNGRAWISGGIFENNKAKSGGAIDVAYCKVCIITGGIFRGNTDNSGYNAIATEKRSGTLLPNLIIGGTLTLEGDQSFCLIDLPSGSGSFKIGTPQELTGTTTMDNVVYTNVPFTGSIKNFIINNDVLDNDDLKERTVFEVKSGQTATSVAALLSINNTNDWGFVADDAVNPPTISIKKKN